MKRCWFILLSLMACGGCSAVKTTFVEVDSQGNLIPCPDRCVRGVPAVVRVHTHYQVTITQTDFWEVKGTNPPRELKHLPSATLREAAITSQMADKIVMIDPKRPLSGTGEFALRFDGNGNGKLMKLNYKAVDTTLKDSAALVTAALKVGGISPQGASGINSNVVKVTRPIAIERFPVDECCRGEIEAFIGRYINNCSPVDCQSPTDYAPLSPEIK